LPPLEASAKVIVVGMDYTAVVPDSSYVGSVKMTDAGMSVGCSYYENVLRLKEMSRNAGANLIIISQHEPADKWSSCDRVWANIYFVEDPYHYEKEIDWSDSRRLTWEDFKGSVPGSRDLRLAAETASELEFQYRSGVFDSGLTLDVRCRFITEKSWVRPEAKSASVLKHEQLHFDITELYARILRKELEEADLTIRDQAKAVQLFNTVSKQHNLRQKNYDKATEHGLNEISQSEWEAMILMELSRLEAYKSESFN
jgi:hypothetical protein